MSTVFKRSSGEYTWQVLTAFVVYSFVHSFVHSFKRLYAIVVVLISSRRLNRREYERILVHNTVAQYP